MEKDTDNKGIITDELGVKRDDKGRFVEGTERHPDAGKKLGSRDFATDFDEVVDDLAKENNMTKSEVRKVLLKVAYKNAKDGIYSFYKDIHDRLYGTAPNKLDITTGGDKIINSEEIIKLANELNELHRGNKSIGGDGVVSSPMGEEVQDKE